MVPFTSRHVVVIGSGAVGTISAIECLRAGHRVTFIDPGVPGGEQAASYGNAGWLSSHSVIPPAEPGMWRQVPGFILDPLGPLSIRWTYLPRVLPWLARFLWAARSYVQIEATATAMRTLLLDAAKLHEQLADEAGVSHLIECRGLLHIYPDRAAFESDARAWGIRRKLGAEWLEISADELRGREPDLHPRYRFAVLVQEAGHCRDPGKYVAALADLARNRGARHVAARATGFRLEAGALAAVTTDQGEVVCDSAVVAAGARSKALTASLGDALPLETERGYHVMIIDAEAGPRTSMMASDAKLIVNAMDGGLRAAGQVEFAGLNAVPNWKRADILKSQLLSIFPKLGRHTPVENLRVWLGHRPSMPDGRPCIGTSRMSPDVVYAFGHGHVGLGGSARTGRLVAQLVTGTPTEISLSPFDPRRFL